MSTDDQPLLDRSTIEAVFRSLGERLARRGVVGDIYVIGGAAMAMAYDSRRATRDIDAVFVPHGVVLDEAKAVAAEFSLPSWWLRRRDEGDITVLVTRLGFTTGAEVFDLCAEIFPP